MDNGTIKQIEEIGFQLCKFGSLGLECDFCTNPKDETFCRISGLEGDDFYWICGKCILAEIKKYPNYSNYKMLGHIDNKQQHNILPF